jgi:membrane-bound lytic murein transglycosylase A
LIAPPPPEKLQLTAVAFDDLPGWSADAVVEALPALMHSCEAIAKKAPDAALGVAGKVRDWQPICAALKNKTPSDNAAAHAFFATWFRPYRAQSPAGSLFTGYYEAQLNGAAQQGGRYQTPLWQKPADLITADLGDFKAELKGQKIVGKVTAQKLTPYDDRAAVAQNSLVGRAQPLVWVDDPITAFFLEIQGSGQVKFEDGSVVRVGYDAQNGHPFVPIGRVLADTGEVDKPVTMRKIRNWLETHPAQAQAMMNKNPSVVFFRRSTADGAVGAQGVTLTPMRSMAVDPSFIPLGVPLFVAFDNVSSGGAPRLVVAQDTGGAIKGAVRGDLFCGVGGMAENFAGNLQTTGTYYLLLPQKVSVQEAAR